MSIDKIEAIFGPDISKLDDKLGESEQVRQNGKMNEDDSEETNLVSKKDDKGVSAGTQPIAWRIEGETVSIKYYIAQRKILINLILMTIIWSIVSFTYSLLTIHIKYIPGDFSLN